MEEAENMSSSGSVDENEKNAGVSNTEDSSQPARLSVQLVPPKAHPAGPPPEEAVKHSKTGPVPLMSIEVAPPADINTAVVAEEKSETVESETQVLQLPRALEE